MTSFHEHERLSNLLCSWTKDPALAEVVLAGDLFDFLQVPGYDGFSAPQAAARFKTITDHAPTAHVLTALRELAQRPGLEISILAGNHDPELLLPDVRAAFEDLIGRRGSVRWADDTPLVPRNGNRLPLWGRAVHIPGAEHDLDRQAWIVHGDRWDPQNVFDRDQVRRSAENGEPFSLPPGSHLVFEVLSKIIHTENRRWVAEVKPDETAALLLLSSHPKETWSYMRRNFGVSERMAAAWLMSLVRRGPAMGAPVAPSTITPDETLPRELVACLAEELDSLDAVERERVIGSFEAFLVQGDPPAVKGTMGRGAVGEWVFRAACRRSANSGFTNRHGADLIPTKAADLVPAAVGALIAGHTHAERERPDLRYCNSGTWMPVRLLSTDPAEVRRMMNAPYQPVSSPRSYVRIELGDRPPLVALENAP